MEHRDRMEDMPLVGVTSRFDSTPEPYVLHIRDEFDDAGNFVEVIHRKRVYDDRIVDEEIL